MALPLGMDNTIPPELKDTEKLLKVYVDEADLLVPTPLDDFPLFQSGEKNHPGRLNGLLYATRKAVAVVLGGFAAAQQAIAEAVGRAQGFADTASNKAGVATNAAGSAAQDAVAGVAMLLDGKISTAGGILSDTKDARDAAIQAQHVAESVVAGAAIDDTGGPRADRARSSQYAARAHRLVSAADQAVVEGTDYAADTRTRSPTHTLPAAPADGQIYNVNDEFGMFHLFPLLLDGNGKSIMGKAEVMRLNIRYASFTFKFQAATNNWVRI
jgi:hypothetical protein